MAARRPPPPTGHTHRVLSRRRRLEARLILGFGGVGLAIVLLVVGLTWAVGRRAELSEVRLQMNGMAGVAEGRLWLTFGMVRSLAQTLAQGFPDDDPTPALRQVLQDATVLQGVGVVRPGRGQLYLSQGPEGMVETHGPEAAVPAPGWTGPGPDAAGEPVFSYATPLEGGGAVLATLGVEQLRRVLREVPMGQPGYYLATDRAGRLLVFPEAEFLMRPAREALPQDLVDRLALGGAGMADSVAPFEGEPGVPVLVAWRTEPISGVRVALVRSHAEILQNLVLLNLIGGAAALGGGLLLLAFVVVMVRRLTGPLHELMSASSRVAHGDLDVQVPESEIEELAEVFTAFNGMVKDLRRHIQELQEATRQQERARRELEIASEIQESFLQPAPLPDGAGFEVHASCREAGQVGGDFYDHFLLADGNLAFCLADVSGKGVPAAIMMAACRTLVRACAHLDPDPARCLHEVNQRLCEGNRLRMFVTCVYGVLDPRTGEVRLCNAGHAPPFLLSPDGGVEAAPRGGNRALGVRPDSPLASQDLRLPPGAGLFLFSDGLNEAQDPDGELFGMARVEEILRRRAALAPRDLLAALDEDLAAFTRGAPPADDRTMLAVRWTPLASRLTLENRVEEVERAQEWLTGVMGSAASPRAARQVALALEELLVNVIRHGLPPGEVSPLRLEAAVRAGRLEVRLEDEGRPFDPTLPPEDPDPAVGGRGLRLATWAVEGLAWRREGGRNVVTFTHPLEAPEGSGANAAPTSPGE